MSLKIRLAQTGKRNARTYRVVAIDESKRRGGRVIEELGFINPNVKPIEITLKKERIEFWQSKGAQITPGVKKFVV